MANFRTNFAQFERNLNETQPDSLVTVLTQFIETVTKSAVDILCKKNRNRVSLQPPWFDKACHTAKRDKF